ncbi:zinc finger (C2H2 type) family protein [Raphanus sativus]|uniref:Uncharacterized protein LOC108836612 n=1 Tax=Raphanus sativus TaxID=3726 RepID=A0A9W3DGJ6_RAPSA|nr:uncharacterized protein LOC108836612 [Raphanus sativus]XP_056862553.1 uncharacterized protein LOC108836612 [Raphanus sativus]KAJ4915453.1 zinc finger (C2H2 type) family protein [Raphanus sativus]
MHGVWLYLKKSVSCCNAQKPSDAVYPGKNLIQEMKDPSGRTRSMSNLRNEFVTYGDEGAMQNQSFRSSRSLESAKFVNTTMRFEGSGAGASSSDLLSGRYSSERFDVIGSDICGLGALSCRICRQRVRDLNAFETHYLSNHCVTRLLEGDFSRTTVELICNRGYYSHKLAKTRGNNISAILKVQNLQRVVAEFENYRELVKIRATKLSKKHSRCVADGNEFLGFHGKTLSCSLGLSSSSNLCFSDQCGVCQILRHGFASKTRPDGIKGVLTASTCSTALECIETEPGGNRGGGGLKAVVLCRVIAGRVHKPMKKFEDPNGFSEFDSLALKVGPNSRLDELYLLSTKALLPCFVIVFKPRNNNTS